jgi:hypothetical protein
MPAERGVLEMTPVSITGFGELDVRDRLSALVSDGMERWQRRGRTRCVRLRAAN